MAEKRNNWKYRRTKLSALKKVGLLGADCSLHSACPLVDERHSWWLQVLLPLSMSLLVVLFHGELQPVSTFGGHFCSSVKQNVSLWQGFRSIMPKQYPGLFEQAHIARLHASLVRSSGMENVPFDLGLETLFLKLPHLC